MLYEVITNSPMAGTFAMATSLVVTPLVSLITKPMPDEYLKTVGVTE